MKQQTLKSFAISFLIASLLACGKPKSDLPETPLSPRNISGDEVSRLQNGVLVRFPATLGRVSENNCIEVFVPENYKKYNGDSKWALPSRLALEWPSFGGHQPGTNVIVTGKMIFIRNSSVPEETCNIIAGQLFEVTKIEYR